MPRSNRALKKIDESVLFQGGFVDRKHDLYFSVDDQTITDVSGRIYAVEVPDAFQPFIFGLAVEVAVQRYNEAVR